MTDATDRISSPHPAPEAAVRMPGGARLMVAFEFFERFSFYALLSLLALFLTTSRTGGGLELGEAHALSILGTFTGLMYAAPLLGGWLADNVVGHRLSLLGGGVIMVFGYCLLTAAAAQAGANVAPLMVWISLAVLVAGNAMMKSTAVIVFGDAFQEAAAARDRAYAYYYMGINLGGVAAGLVAGTLVSATGWAEGFAACALAMGIACGAFALFHRRLLNFQPPRRTAGHLAAPDRGGVAGRLGAIAVYALALCILSIAVFQLFGVISLFLENRVDRHIAGMEVPTQWFIALYSLVLIAVPPLLAAWRPGRPTSAPRRYAAALAFSSLSLLLFTAAAKLGQGSGLGLVIGGAAIVLLATGEVAAWTVSYSLVYRLAPAGTGGLVMGAFYAVTLGLGGFLAGKIGALAAGLGYEPYFLVLAVLMAVPAMAMMVFGNALDRWTQRLYALD